MKMNSIISRVILFLYLFINALFVDKYISRITSYHWLAVIAYVLVTCVVIWIVNRLLKTNKHSTKYFWSILIGITIVAVGIQYAIDPLFIQVDRWSAIHNFLAGMLQGVYPYGQQTHLGGYGSPFPIWQLFHLPFYALGNVGLSIVVVTILFLWTLCYLYSKKVAIAAGVFLCISPAFWYEVAVRSDLITNIMLSAIIVEWLVHKNIKLNDHWVWIGCIVGLVLSTRFVAIIPICVIYGYEFLQMNWKKQSLFILIIIAIFALTMLPFVFWKGSTLLFFDYNPFVLQTRQGSWLVLLIFAIIAIGVTIWMHERMTYRWVITGLLLTSLVTMAFVEKMWQQNLWNGLFTSAFDITYLSIALPFYIEYLSYSVTDKTSCIQ